MTAKSQILLAESLGMIANQQGKHSAPSMNKDLMQMMAGRKIGQTPANEASSVAIMKAYSKGWHTDNILSNKALTN